MMMKVTFRSKYLSFLFQISFFCALFKFTQAETIQGETSSCLTNNYMYECSDSCPCGFGTYEQAALIFNLVITIIGCIACLMVIHTGFTIKEMRDPPGDIFIGIAMACFILCASWTVQTILFLSDKSNEDSNIAVCQVTSYIDVLASTFIYLYNFAFFVFYYTLTRASLKVGKIPQSLYHLIPVVISLGLATVIYFFPSFLTAGVSDPSRLFGMSVYRRCSFKSTTNTNLEVASLIFYAVLPIFMYKATIKSLPECKKVARARYHLLRNYMKFVIFTSIINLFIISSGIYIAKHLPNLAEEIENDNTLNFGVRLASNLFRIMRPLVLCLIRLSDSTLTPYWIRNFWWSRLLCCPSRNKKNGLEVNLAGEVEREDLDGKKTFMTMTFRTIHKDLKNNPYVNEIKQALKVQVLYSILSSIHCYWRISKKTVLSNYAASTTGFKVDYQKIAKLTEKVDINDDILKRELPEMMKEVQRRRYKLIEGRLTVHAPALFGELIEMEKEQEKLVKSLNLEKNYQRIVTAKEGTGGKSGEFFFFSSDENLVIKTISKEELNTLLEILPDYVKHFKENPNSLIAKIFGVFTFERFNPYEQYHLLLMKNVCGYQSKFVERKYDLKGSTYTRFTVPLDENPSIYDLKHQQLKDIDFNRFEQKIHVSPNLREKALRALKADAQFMRKKGLIDYSLIVYIIDKESDEESDNSNKANNMVHNSLGNKPANDFGDSSNSFVPSTMLQFEISAPENLRGERAKSVETMNLGSPKKSSAEALRSMRSTKEDERHLYYHCGVIDYLNKYTWKKALEIWYKKIKTLNPNLNLSAQNSVRYAVRFSNYMAQVFSE